MVRTAILIKMKDLAQIAACSTYIILMLTLVVRPSLSSCPEPSHIPGCTCDNEHGQGKVTCKDFTGEKFKQLFTDMEKLAEHGERHLHHVVLTGEACDGLLEHTFQDISVDYVEIRDAPNFKSIHTNALDDLNKVIEYFDLVNLPALDVSNLFEIINKMRSLETLHLNDLAKLEEIPSEAFKVMKKLFLVELKGKNIKKINDKAFWNLNYVHTIEITGTSIDHLSDDALAFKPSESLLTIGLFNNPSLPCTGFSPNTFVNIGRPTSLDFSGYHYVDDHNRKQLTCMPENVFKPFLEKHDWNDVDLYEIDFDCNNCDNAWIKKTPSVLDKLMSIECEGGKHIDEEDVFKDCK